MQIKSKNSKFTASMYEWREGSYRYNVTKPHSKAVLLYVHYDSISGKLTINLDDCSELLELITQCQTLLNQNTCKIK